MLNVNYANRGKSLEELINYAKQQYLAKRVALVQHIPIDWTVIRRGTQISSIPCSKIDGGLVEMLALRKIFRVELHEIMSYWLAAEAGGRKSIPLMDFDKFQVVGQAGGIVLDYLGVYS